MADIATLAAEIKEIKRLHKILDDFTSEIHKTLSADILTNKHELKALEKKVLDLEKKQKK